ncbi:MAG: hypothetical protein AVO35_03945 [Candidatus Aegiribacteria sp. MLS_C]|nr:MAG: hypothetical protein AVO35_03945 [Candidatus Aegiribacteria sp. MLS_C]
MVVSIFSAALSAQAPDILQDFWWEASGARLDTAPFSLSSLNERSLKSQLGNGNRNALMPLVMLLVTEGRMDEAEAWMEGRGRLVPVTRRDLGIALSWYGRYELHSVLSTQLEVPSDLDEDDYGRTLAAIVDAGWMHCAYGDLFMPDLLAGPSDLILLQGVFFPDPVSWDREWIGMASLDSLFAAGIEQGVSR